MLSEGSYIVSGMILRQLVTGEVRATICSEEMSWRDIWRKQPYATGAGLL